MERYENKDERLAILELRFEQMLTVIVIVAPMGRRARKDMDSHVGSPGNSAAQASDPPDSTEDIIAFFASHVEAIDIALVHIKTIVDERSRIVDIVTLLDIGNEHFCKFRRRRSIRHKAPSETAGQQKRAALFIELGVASPLDVHVTVQLEEIHFAVAIKD
jgi:hypothetical protein